MKHKYVRHSVLGVAMFPADTNLSHKDIAWMMNRRSDFGGNIVSAAFVWIEKDRVVLEGKSESLGIGQHSDDAATIRNQLGYFSEATK